MRLLHGLLGLGLIVLTGCTAVPAGGQASGLVASPTPFQPWNPTLQPYPGRQGPDAVGTLSAELSATTFLYRRSDVSGVAREIVSQINALRKQEGLAPLVSTATLMGIAQLRAEDMVARGYFSHDDPRTGLPAPEALLVSSGYTGRVAENLYTSNAPLDQLAAAAVQAWQDSEAHRANLLDSHYRFTGVGVMGDGSMWKVCQLFAEQAPG